MDGSFYFLGGRVPVVVGGLVAATIIVSVLAAVARLGGTSLASEVALIPGLIWTGQIWRLVTWVFLDDQPLSLLFSCMVLWWLGRDLVGVWGPRRFLGLYLSFAVIVGALTVVIAWLVLGERGGLWPYYSAWPLVDALTIAWALYFPHRQVLIYFVLPLSGRNLIYLVVGGTILWALFNGPANYIPHLLAEGLMFAYMKRPMLQRLWRSAGFSVGRRRSPRLREVRRDAWKEPPRWLH